MTEGACKKPKNEASKVTDGVESGKAGMLFEDFLREQGTYEATTKRALKHVKAHKLAVKQFGDSLLLAATRTSNNPPRDDR